MLAPEIKQAILALPINDVHALDEAIHAGGALDSAAALATVDALLERVNAAPWPVELEAMIGEVKTKAQALHTALESADMTAAGSLAIEPVSYTHLDVYKRQAQGSSPCRRLASSRRCGH